MFQMETLNLRDVKGFTVAAPLTVPDPADPSSVPLPHLPPLGSATSPREPQSKGGQRAQGAESGHLAPGPGFAAVWLCGCGHLAAPCWGLKLSL